MNKTSWPFVPNWPITEAESFWPFPKIGEETTEVKMEKVSEDESSVSILHCFDPYHNKGGVCIAYRMTSLFKNTRMVEVALSYCSPHDTYSKKIGAKKARDRFLMGNTVLVPCGDRDDLQVRYNLEKMFYI